MAIDAETLKGILEAEDVTSDDKIKRVISEHEADTRGLVQNRDSLLEERKKLKEQLKAGEEKVRDEAARAAQFEEELKKNDPGEARKMWESEHRKQLEALETEKTRVAEERDRFKTSHYTRLRNDAINEGIKDLRTGRRGCRERPDAGNRRPGRRVVGAA
jgi:transposase